MKRNILVLLTCSLGMTAWGETHVLDGAQSSNSIVYVARYSYDDMGNMVLRRWVPNYASLRMEDGGDSPEELRNLVEGVDVSVRADNLWRNVRFSISGGTWSRVQRDVERTPEGDGAGWIRKTPRGGRLDGSGRLFGRPEASNRTARGV